MNRDWFAQKEKIHESYSIFIEWPHDCRQTIQTKNSRNKPASKRGGKIPCVCKRRESRVTGRMLVSKRNHHQAACWYNDDGHCIPSRCWRIELQGHVHGSFRSPVSLSFFLLIEDDCFIFCWSIQDGLVKKFTASSSYKRRRSMSIRARWTQ